MPYVIFFLSIVWYTLGAIVICGLCVSLCRRLFVKMMGGGAGRTIVQATSIIGTPVHELGHAAMCLLFGHRIVEMSLWQPRSSDGTLGHVSHTYNRRNPYHILGNLFIGIGPVFSGLAVLTLFLKLCFPGALATYFANARFMVAAGQGGISLFLEGIKLFPHMVREAATDASVPLWARIIGVLLILSVSLHIELSPADIKGALKAIPIYLVPVLLLTVICGLIGAGAMNAVTGALALFSAMLTSLFVIVLVASVAQLLLAMPVWLIRKLVRG